MLSYTWVVCVQGAYMLSYTRDVCVQGAYMLVNPWKLEEMKIQRFYILRSSSQEGLKCSDTSDPSIGSKELVFE
jgi:hypothetical protein